MRSMPWWARSPCRTCCWATASCRASRCSETTSRWCWSAGTSVSIVPESSSESSATALRKEQDLSALAPLSYPVFRMLWFTWLAANTTMWMNDVAAAWLMTSFNTTPLWVALVQTASTLLVFMLGLPSGALADTLDRRRYFMITQFWIAGVAVLMCTAVITHVMSAPLLLVLTFF